MPSNHEEHVQYTNYEWKNIIYFLNLLNYLKNNNIKNIIDVGANVGEVTNILLEDIPSIEKIYLFEPEYNNYSFIEKRFKENKKIITYNYGIYYGADKLNMYRCDDNVGGFSLQQIGSIKSEIVSLKTFEEFNFLNIDFIKFDVEGSEYNILKNSKFIKDIKFIEIEIHEAGIDPDINYSDKEQRKKIITERYFNRYLPNHRVVYDWESHFFLEKTI